MSAITPGVVKRMHTPEVLYVFFPRPRSNNILPPEKSSMHSPFLGKVIHQDTEQELPSSWFLVHKGGNPSQSGNFRPIALSSVIPKTYHKILAKRLEHYLLRNNIVDPNLQKGFLSGINGTCLPSLDTG